MAAETPAATPTSSVQPAAARLVARAVQATRALRSYTYLVTATVAARRPLVTHISGRVVRDQGIAYQLTVGTRQTQVIRLRTATYVRTVPGRWARRTDPGDVSDPTASLLSVLSALTGLATDSATTVHGLLPTTAASTARIPTNGQPAQVSVTVDTTGHVTRLTVRTTTTVAKRTVTVTTVTNYARFDRAPPIRRPV